MKPKIELSNGGKTKPDLLFNSIGSILLAVIVSANVFVYFSSISFDAGYQQTFIGAILFIITCILVAASAYYYFSQKKVRYLRLWSFYRGILFSSIAFFIATVLLYLLIMIIGYST